MTSTTTHDKPVDADEVAMPEPVLRASGLVKRYGPVTAIAGSDLELYPGEILAVSVDQLTHRSPA